MGRLAIMMVMGLAVALATVGYQINQSNVKAIEHVTGFQCYTTARNMAHIGVNNVLRKFDKGDTSLINTVERGEIKKMNTGFLTGTCSTYTSLVNYPVRDTVQIISKAFFIDSTYTMRVRVSRSPTPFPGVGAAVGLRVPNVAWGISGNAAWIDGHDHDMNGNLLAASAGDKPGVAVLTPGDTSKVLANANLIDGTRDVVQDSSIADPSLYASQYINAADYVYTGPGVVSSNLTWGSVSAPVIVYANATAGAIKFTGNIEGWGILICKGDLTMAGTFKFHGLVIAYNDITITEQASLSTGTPVIIGAFIMAGASGSSFTLKGNDAIVYSSAAIANAMYIGKLQAYKVQQWYE